MRLEKKTKEKLEKYFNDLLINNKKKQVNNKHRSIKGEAAKLFELPSTRCWYSGHVGLFVLKAPS